jgi:hypothetical protein
LNYNYFKYSFIERSRDEGKKVRKMMNDYDIKYSTTAFEIQLFLKIDSFKVISILCALKLASTSLN